MSSAQFACRAADIADMSFIWAVAVVNALPTAFAFSSYVLPSEFFISNESDPSLNTLDSVLSHTFRCSYSLIPSRRSAEYSLKSYFPHGYMSNAHITVSPFRGKTTDNQVFHFILFRFNANQEGNTLCRRGLWIHFSKTAKYAYLRRDRLWLKEKSRRLHDDEVVAEPSRLLGSYKFTILEYKTIVITRSYVFQWRNTGEWKRVYMYY